MNTRLGGANQTVSDLHNLLDAVERTLGKLAVAPERHVTRNSGHLELHTLLHSLRERYKSAGVPNLTGCCGVTEIQGIYGASPTAILATLHAAKVSHNPGMFYATTSTGQVETIRSLKRAGFTLAMQALNPRYQAWDKGHTTQLWLMDANHIPEKPLDLT